MKRTADDLNRANEIQRKAIAAYCKAYDRGAKWEALRLATAVYTMVHDGGRTKSVLSQEGIKAKLMFVASGRAVTDDIMQSVDTSSCLIELERNKQGNANFVPLCAYYERRGMHFEMRLLPFDEWWQKDVIAFERKPDKPVMVVDVHGGRIPKDPHGKAFQSAMTNAITKIDEATQKFPDDEIIPGTQTKLTRKQLVSSLRNQDGGSHFDSELHNPNYISLLRPVYLFSYPMLNICVNRELAMMRQIAEELRLTLLANGVQNNGDLPKVVLGFGKIGRMG